MLYQLPRTSSIPGPGKHFLILPGDNPNHILRVDDRGRPVAGWKLPWRKQDGLEGLEPICRIHASWEVIAVRQNLGRLFHLRENGGLERIFNLHWDLAETPILLDHRFSEDRYWLLFKTGQAGETATRLMVLSTSGELEHYWYLPFEADGFDLTPQRLLLYRRASGSAQIYGRG